LLRCLALRARAAGPSEPGGIDEFDESIPTRRSSTSIRTSSASITASRSASAANNSSRLAPSGTDTQQQY